MLSHRISMLVGSSQYAAIADDALKDEDNAAWVMQLPAPVRQAWVECIYWIRWLDRLAESDQLASEQSPRLQAFYDAWKWLLAHRQIPADCRDAQILLRMGTCWGLIGNQQPHWPCIRAWDHYVEAIVLYHQNDLRIETLDQYETMLSDLGGTFFQVLPFLSIAQQPVARYLGMVDQIYNHLRDLWEDARQGLCYFPAEILDHFGIERADLLNATCLGHPNYIQMMEFWLDEYLPKLQRQSARLLMAEDLHPSWQQLCEWSVHRYSRIERVLRNCQFNYIEFAQQYWQAVKRDLFLYHHGISPELNQWQQRHQRLETAHFLRLSPATLTAVRTLQQHRRHANCAAAVSGVPQPFIASGKTVACIL